MPVSKKYQTVEEVQVLIDKYFEGCFKPVYNSEGEIIHDENGEIVKKQVRPFTISGLADALDLSRQSLLNYQKTDIFFDTITRAKRKCEVYAEERLFDKEGVVGAKFNLINNYGKWKEKQEVEQTNVDRIMIVNDLPDEED